MIVTSVQIKTAKTQNISIVLSSQMTTEYFFCYHLLPIVNWRASRFVDCLRES